MELVPPFKEQPFKFIRQFDEYNIAYSAEATRVLGKPHWFTKSAYVFFLGDKFSNRFVFVPAGYFTDGSSTPSLFQSLLPVWGPHGAAVIMHDKLCECGYALEVNPAGEVSRVKLTRKEIDEAFIEALKVIKTDNMVIRLVDLGFGLHRGLIRPPVPNPDVEKDRFQDRHTLDNRIVNIREEQVWEFLDEDIKHLFNAAA